MTEDSAWHRASAQPPGVQGSPLSAAAAHAAGQKPQEMPVETILPDQTAREAGSAQFFSFVSSMQAAPQACTVSESPKVKQIFFSTLRCRIGNEHVIKEFLGGKTDQESYWLSWTKPCPLRKSYVDP